MSYDETQRVSSEIPGSVGSAEVPPVDRADLVRDGGKLTAAVTMPWMAENGVRGAPVHGPSEVAVLEVEAFYRDVFHELDLFIRRPSATAAGAAVVVKRVARAHGVEVADRLPLPRLNRAELEDRADNVWRAEQ